MRVHVSGTAIVVVTAVVRHYCGGIYRRICAFSSAGGFARLRWCGEVVYLMRRAKKESSGLCQGSAQALVSEILAR